MTTPLQGKKIAFLFTEGVEQAVPPHRRAKLARIPPRPPQRRAMALSAADDFDGLVLPGGVANPDALRADRDAVEFTRGFFDQGKPVGVICHGPWTLVEADVVRGRTLTSWPSLQTDLRNAGANWVDEEVHVDNGLVSSRNPDDLPAFCERLVEALAQGSREVHRQVA